MSTRVTASNDEDGGEEAVYAAGELEGASNQPTVRESTIYGRDFGHSSEVEIGSKLKRNIVVFVESTAEDGARLQEVVESVKGFIHSCVDKSGSRCSPLQVIREQLSDEIEVRSVDGRNRLFIREAYLETYIGNASDVELHPKMKEDVVLAVGLFGEDGASLQDMMKTVQGFMYNCDDPSGNHCSPLQVVRELLSEEIEVRSVDGKNRLFIRESYLKTYQTVVMEKSRIVKEVRISDKMKQEIVLVVGAAGEEGVTPSRLRASIKGLTQSCRHHSGAKCNLLDVIKEHLSDEVEARPVRGSKRVVETLFIKESYLETYKALKAEAQAAVEEKARIVKEVCIGNKMKREIVLLVGAAGEEGVTPKCLGASIKGLKQSCRHHSGAKCNLLDVIKEHLSDEIELRSVRGSKRVVEKLFIKKSYLETYKALKAEAQSATG